MATSTTNLGLIKPAGTDKIRIAQINGNMDVIDEKVGPVGNTSLQAQVNALGANVGGAEKSIAIVINKNKTSIAAAAGDYLILKDSTISGCDDGAYVAAQAIPANTVIDSTYLTALPKGGLNGVYSSLSDQIANLDIVTNAQVVATDKIIAYRAGRVVFLTCISGTYSTNSNGKLAENGDEITIPEKYRPIISANLYEPVSQKRFTFANDGKIYVDGTLTNVACRFSTTYITNKGY